MELTQEWLREALQYDEETGDFTWREDRPLHHSKNKHGYAIWHSKYAGKVAGAVGSYNGKEYLRIKLDGKPYLAHRLAFLYKRNEWPKEVDHKNGEGLDNRWRNLRKSSRNHNMRNSQPSEKAGYLPVGVYCNVSKRHGVVWYWSVGTYNKQVNRLYKGPDLFEAVCARKTWENEMLEQGNFTHRHFKRN